MFRAVDRFIEGFVLFTVSGIKTIVSCHFKLLFRYVLDEQFDEVDCGKSFLHIGIIFVTVVMEGDIFPIVRVNTF